MSEYFVIASFELHPKQMENWLKLSTQIDTDIATVDGFISRDIGIDDNNRIYCLVKWQSRSHQETFMQSVMERNPDMMAEFGEIANFETMQHQKIDIL